MNGLTIEKSIDLGGLQTEIIKLTVENFGIIPEGKQDTALQGLP